MEETVGDAGLLLAGRSFPHGDNDSESGSNWYMRMLEILAKESKDHDSPEVHAYLEARDTACFQKMIRQK